MMEVICAHPDYAIEVNDKRNFRCDICARIWDPLLENKPEVVIGYVNENPHDPHKRRDDFLKGGRCG